MSDANVTQCLDQATTADRSLDRWAAIEHLRQAQQAAPDDPRVCFRLAYHLDLVGEDEEAQSLYERACSVAPASVNALINLAVMYEDEGDYAKAERCLKLVTETNPNHLRARLFLKDVRASRHMIIREDAAGAGPSAMLLATPVTDFDLSTRAVNCLRKLGVRTLGDLTRISESELATYKNLGQGTLGEIKTMLSSRGLRLGQTLAQSHDSAREEIIRTIADSENPEAASQLDRPVADLNLSVRATKALELLGLQTIADLVTRTEAELLGIKNFGQTSLDEINTKLSELGLALRQV